MLLCQLPCMNTYQLVYLHPHSGSGHPPRHQGLCACKVAMLCWAVEKQGFHSTVNSLST